jgi:hypothetical protein
MIVDSSDTTVTNPYIKDIEGYHVNNSDIIDCGEDIVYVEKANLMYSELLTDAGEDITYDITEDYADLVNGIEDGIQIDNQVALL